MQKILSIKKVKETRTSWSLAKNGKVGWRIMRRKTSDGFVIFLLCLHFFIKFNKIAIL
jgi:hypothetical protein